MQVQDLGLFLYSGWPILLPWHILKTRGARGWGLIIKLLALIFCAIDHAVSGADLPYVALMWGRSPTCQKLALAGRGPHLSELDLQRKTDTWIGFPEKNQSSGSETSA
jgi:hypothetical protein